MPGNDQSKAATDRRGGDRRVAQKPFSPPERRAAERRSGSDRRTAPRD